MWSQYLKSIQPNDSVDSIGYDWVHGTAIDTEGYITS